MTQTSYIKNGGDWFQVIETEQSDDSKAYQVECETDDEKITLACTSRAEAKQAATLLNNCVAWIDVVSWKTSD